MKSCYLVIGLCLAGGVLTAAARPYSRYAPIVERAPFGQPPANFNPAVNPSTVSARSGANGGKELTAEQEQLKKTVKFSAINLDPEGVLRVGFSDMSSAKMPRHYYLKVGETRDGWVVNEANAAERRVKISKDGVELELDLGNEATGAAAKSAATPAPLAATPASTPKAIANEKPTLLGRRGILAKRREADEKRKAEQEAQKKKDEEERDKMREDLAAMREEIRQERENRENEKAKEKETAAPAPAAEVDEPPPPPPEEGGESEGEAENGE